MFLSEMVNHNTHFAVNRSRFNGTASSGRYALKTISAPVKCINAQDIRTAETFQRFFLLFLRAQIGSIDSQ